MNYEKNNAAPPSYDAPPYAQVNGQASGPYPQNGAADPTVTPSSPDLYESTALGVKVCDAPIEIRTAFVRKVYLLLVMQLFMTTAIASLIYGWRPLREFAQKSLAMLITSFVLSFVLLCAAIGFRKKHPVNLYLLFGFTACIAYSVGVSVSFYDLPLVLIAAGITLMIFVGLTMFTVYSKKDFSGMGPFLHVFLMTIIFASLIQLILMASGVKTGKFDVLIAGASALVFSLYIVFDTYMIFNRLSVEEYVPAAIELYLDIINLFLNILRILAYFSGNGNRN